MTRYKYKWLNYSLCYTPAAADESGVVMRPIPMGLRKGSPYCVAPGGAADLAGLTSTMSRRSRWNASNKPAVTSDAMSSPAFLAMSLKTNTPSCRRYSAAKRDAWRSVSLLMRSKTRSCLLTYDACAFRRMDRRNQWKKLIIVTQATKTNLQWDSTLDSTLGL